jgi:hypothetical protein
MSTTVYTDYLLYVEDLSSVGDGGPVQGTVTVIANNNNLMESQ